MNLFLGSDIDTDRWLVNNQNMAIIQKPPANADLLLVTAT
jgi:hypothetical protein